jgi:hypothetical protein
MNNAGARSHFELEDRTRPVASSESFDPMAPHRKRVRIIRHEVVPAPGALEVKFHDSGIQMSVPGLGRVKSQRRSTAIE